MILVDTSVWIEHLQAGSERLRALLLDEQVLCHPFVVGELACGTLQKRSEILSMLKALPEAAIGVPVGISAFCSRIEISQS